MQIDYKAKAEECWEWARKADTSALPRQFETMARAYEEMPRVKERLKALGVLPLQP